MIVEPVASKPTVGMREEDWPTDAEGIARLIARMEQIEPFVMTPEEEADWIAWRQRIKEYELANFDKRIEGLFE